MAMSTSRVPRGATGPTTTGTQATDGTGSDIIAPVVGQSMSLQPLAGLQPMARDAGGEGSPTSQAEMPRLGVVPTARSRRGSTSEPVDMTAPPLELPRGTTAPALGRLPPVVPQASVVGRLKAALALANQSPTPQNIMAAHDAQVAYSNSGAEFVAGSLAFLKQTLEVGFAGSGFTFGIGRTFGDEMGRIMGSAAFGQPIAMGFKAPPRGENPLAGPVPEFVKSVLGHFVAAGTGGLANLVGQKEISKLFSAMPYQYTAVNERILLPDEMRNLMNQLHPAQGDHPGWGDAVLQSIIDQQGNVANVNSDRNKRISQLGFIAMVATRAAIQSYGMAGQPLGFAGNMVMGFLVSAFAGMFIGGMRAVGMSSAKHAVPDMATLTAERDRPEGAPARSREQLMNAGTEVNLFFRNYLSPAERSSVLKSTVGPPIRDRDAQGQERPSFVRPTGRDLRNVGTSWLNRAMVLHDCSTALDATVFTVAAFGDQMPGWMNLLLLSAGIATAVRIWFDDVVKIAVKDAKLHPEPGLKRS